MMKEKRHSYIVLALILAAMITSVGIFMGLQSSKRPSDISVKSGNLRVTGTALCLPHKDTSGPQTMECGIGIKDDKGEYYALNDSDNNYANISSLPMNERVTIEGTFETVKDSVYPIKGTIRIAKIER